MIKLCALLDKIGCWHAADEVLRLVTAQYLQPSNNQNVPIKDRVIPWADLDGSFKQRDYDMLENDPRFRTPEYIALPGAFEPPAFSADGGTSNLTPSKLKKVNQRLIKQLENILNFDISIGEQEKIKKQIQMIKQGLLTGQYLQGNPFDMLGPDEVPGPKQAIIDHTSPSMVGLDGFSWEQRHKVWENSTDSYKNLLPN